MPKHLKYFGIYLLSTYKWATSELKCGAIFLITCTSNLLIEMKNRNEKQHSTLIFWEYWLIIERPRLLFQFLSSHRCKKSLFVSYFAPKMVKLRKLSVGYGHFTHYLYLSYNIIFMCLNITYLVDIQYVFFREPSKLIFCPNNDVGRFD